MLSSQSGKPNIKVVQDSLLGAYLMTNGHMPIDKSDFYSLCMKGERYDGTDLFDFERIDHIKEIYKKYNIPEEWNGKWLISLLLPKNFWYDHDGVKVRKGVMIQGPLTKKHLGGNHYSLIQILHNEYSVDIAANFIDNIQFITNNWLLIHGFSVGLEDFMASTPKIHKSIKEALTRCYIEAEGVENVTHNPGIREVRVIAALSKAKDIGMKIAKEGMSKHNNLLTYIRSGAKGDFFNIAQITGLVGQQNLECGRAAKMLSNGTRTLPHYPFEKLPKKAEYESRGFIRHSFIHGINPREFFFHAISGREGICSTAFGTADSGYAQRRLIKLCEDIQVRYDGTVRNNTGKIYQFAYGENHLNPGRCNPKGFCDVNRLVQTLNGEIED